MFGDPSMMIYTEQPVEISNTSFRINNNTIHVETTESDARVSFYTPGTTPIVDSYLGNSVDYTTIKDSVIICIDRHNCIPFVATYHKNEFIQNETITDSRTYVGKTVKVGRNVTTTKPEGAVVINGLFRWKTMDFFFKNFMPIIFLLYLHTKQMISFL